MEACDVLVVGGGPAGSTCAGRLRQAGLDVLLLDAQTFPREKPCAGWITPAVFQALALDPEEYRPGRLLQDISSFRIGTIHGDSVVTSYDTTVSYGIRRYEFDHFLLQRSRVRQVLGEPVTTLHRKDGWWCVNGRIRSRLLVGAGGHFCPVAHHLGARIGREEIVAAQVAEFNMSQEEGQACRIQSDTPELFFCRDMKGYGWMFRKGNYLNVGLGRRDTTDVARHTKDFYGFLKQRMELPSRCDGRFLGHAYRLFQRQGSRSCVGDGALLVGDAAGVAHPQSGEGILPAIESAYLAAETILEARGEYVCANLESYADRLSARYDDVSTSIPSSLFSAGLLSSVGARLLSNSWFTRHIVLDRWFLHVDQKALKVA